MFESGIFAAIKALMMKSQVQRFGKFLSGMVMPNIGAFIAWGLMAALFIPAGWIPCKPLAELVKMLRGYSSKVTLTFGLKQGSVVSVSVEGTDEDVVLDAVGEFIQKMDK
ncbi:MAG: hypothetical protein QMB59_01185 [Bacteroidales bacterium]